MFRKKKDFGTRAVFCTVFGNKLDLIFEEDRRIFSYEKSNCAYSSSYNGCFGNGLR